MGILLGIVADSVFGDPQRGHPVAFFGRASRGLERRIHRDSRLAGAAHVGVLLVPVVAASALTEAALRRHPWWHAALSSVTTWSALCGTSLRRECLGILRPLRDGDLPAVRARMPRLFFADTPDIDDDEVLRETITTLTENTLDAAIGPLFWSAVAGPAGALGYRILNNLDGLIGFPSSRYRRFGWFTARLDDLANWVPARLAGLAVVICAPVVGGSPRATWRVLRRDAAVDPSPNSGVLYAAFCGALNITLARPNRVTAEPPWYVFGDGQYPDIDDAVRTVRLSRVVELLFGVTVLALPFARRSGSGAG